MRKLPENADAGRLYKPSLRNVEDAVPYEVCTTPVSLRRGGACPSREIRTDFNGKGKPFPYDHAGSLHKPTKASPCAHGEGGPLAADEVPSPTAKAGRPEADPYKKFVQTPL